MARKTNTSHLAPEEKIVYFKQENERLRHIIGVQKEDSINFKQSTSIRMGNLIAIKEQLETENGNLMAKVEDLKTQVTRLKEANDFLTSRNFFQRLFNVMPE